MTENTKEQQPAQGPDLDTTMNKALVALDDLDEMIGDRLSDEQWKAVVTYVSNEVVEVAKRATKMAEQFLAEQDLDEDKPEGYAHD